MIPIPRTLRIKRKNALSEERIKIFGNGNAYHINDAMATAPIHTKRITCKIFINLSIDFERTKKLITKVSSPSHHNNVRKIGSIIIYSIYSKRIFDYLLINETM